MTDSLKAAVGKHHCWMAETTDNEACKGRCFNAGACRAFNEGVVFGETVLRSQPQAPTREAVYETLWRHHSDGVKVQTDAVLALFADAAPTCERKRCTCSQRTLLERPFAHEWSCPKRPGPIAAPMENKMNYATTLLAPNAPDAEYANKPAIAQAVHDMALREIKRLEEMLIEGTEKGATRCKACEQVRDLNDITADGMACWVCARRD